jgi:hypothetical protein
MDIVRFKDLAKQFNFSFIEVLTLAASYNYLWCLSQVYFPHRLHYHNMGFARNHPTQTES